MLPRASAACALAVAVSFATAHAWGSSNDNNKKVLLTDVKTLTFYEVRQRCSSGCLPTLSLGNAVLAMMHTTP